MTTFFLPNMATNLLFVVLASVTHGQEFIESKSSPESGFCLRQCTRYGVYRLRIPAINVRSSISASSVPCLAWPSWLRIALSHCVASLI